MDHHKSQQSKNGKASKTIKFLTSFFEAGEIY